MVKTSRVLETRQNLTGLHPIMKDGQERRRQRCVAGEIVPTGRHNIKENAEVLLWNSGKISYFKYKLKYTGR